MVTAGRNFRRNESGISLVEGLITFPLVLLVIITFVEFGYAVFQWSQAGKATAIGARLAAVSSPVATNYGTLDDDYANNAAYAAGQPLPTASRSVSCTPASKGVGETLNVCNSGALRIVRGSDGVCDSNYGTTVPGMCDLNPWIEPRKVVITYTRGGLGYVGRSAGPVNTVTVSLRDMKFNFFFVAALLGLDNLNMPATPVTVTGEDMASCANPSTTATNFATPCP